MFVCVRAHLGKQYSPLRPHSKTTNFVFTLPQIPRGLSNYFLGFLEGRVSVLQLYSECRHTHEAESRKKKKKKTSGQAKYDQACRLFSPFSLILPIPHTKRRFLQPYLLSCLHLTSEISKSQPYLEAIQPALTR